MDRRAYLKLMSGLAGAVALGPLAACSGSQERRGRGLMPVRVERGLIKRIDVGLRPFRPRTGMKWTTF